MGLLIHELIHIFLSATSAYVCYRYAKREKKKHRHELLMICILGGLLGGFFVDLDHLIDYTFVYGLNFNLHLFLSGEMFVQMRKIHILFHGWEYIAAMWLIAYKTKNLKLRYFMLSTLLGLFSHLVFDMYSNNVHFFGYSILYRIVYNFDMMYVTGH